MKVKTARKIGLLTATSISISSVIGIGIFFKNFTVLGAQTVPETDTFAFWSFILAWVLGAFISLLTVYSFSELSSSRQSKSGLAGWVEELSGSKKQGMTVKFLHSGFYYALLTAALPVFGMEAIFKAFKVATGSSVSQEPEFYLVVILLSLVFLVAMTVLNYFSLKWSSRLQVFSTAFKLLPLAIAFILGFVGTKYLGVDPKATDSASLEIVNKANEAKSYYLFGGLSYGITSGEKSFNFAGMFIALPAVLFAFDSFLSVGNLAKDVKNPKTVPVAAVLTIVISATVYILISIGAALKGTGFVGNLFTDIVLSVSKDPATRLTASKVLNSFVFFLIGFGALFVANSTSIVLLKSSEGLIESRQVMFYKKLGELNKRYKNLGSLVLYSVFVSIYLLVVVLPSTISLSDSVIDSSTNLPTIMFFFIYAYTMLLGIIDRFKGGKKTKLKVKGFLPASVLAILLIVAVIGFQFVYKFIVKTTQSPNVADSAGLFFSGTTVFTLAHNSLTNFGLLALCIILALTNYFVVKKQLRSEGLTIEDTGNASDSEEEISYEETSHEKHEGVFCKMMHKFKPKK